MTSGEQAYRALARLAHHDLRPNGRPASFAEYLTRHFLESFLHRLTQSAHADAGLNDFFRTGFSV